jgi:hypothetical protein
MRQTGQPHLAGILHAITNELPGIMGPIRRKASSYLLRGLCSKIKVEPTA